MIEKPNLDWLLAYRSKEPHFGLERMEALLALRSNPHLQVPVIHVTGTNGKGSTIAHLRQLLSAMGLYVGVFSSPYLVTYTEQFQIDGKNMPQEVLQAYLASYQELLAAEQGNSSLLGLTEFEIVTALAYEYFAQEQVDVALIEVGMGGRLDSTNVCQPVLTAITTIGLDHTQLLGDTLADIAYQKAGIIKPGVPILIGKLPAEALEVIVAEASRQQSPLTRLGQDFQAQYLGSLPEGERFAFESRLRESVTLVTPLLGQHQVDNAALAIQLADSFAEKRGLPLLTEKQLQAALSRTIWPGRLEVISQEPLVLLDGAHNPHAVAPLVQTLEQRYAGYDKTILFSCIQTKALEEMLDLLSQLPQSRLTLTSFEDSRAVSMTRMAQLAQERGVEIAAWQAFLKDYMKEKKEPNQVLIITGSLYFLSQVRDYLWKGRENGQE